MKTADKSKWYQGSLGIIAALVLFFPLGLFLMWKYAKWNKKVKWIVSGLFAFLLLSGAFTNKDQPKEAPAAISVSPTPISTTQPSTNQQTKTVPEKISEIVKKESGDQASVSIFHGDKVTTDTNRPYEVIVNFNFNHTITACENAKMASYDILKALYKDADIRQNLQRVLITIPYFLRTSLGASDGSPMAEKNTFSGPTLYWKLMEDVRFSTEKETGPLEDRTWSVLFGNCAK